ncbi:MAG: NAD-dependent epimerase/dehydratase family protein [Alphaproteobacteria bacterium]
MGDRVLVTGGAGFIGRRVTDALLARGHRVRVLDALIPQVHGDAPRADMPDGVEFIRGDVRDAAAVAAALKGVDKVVHLAAEVGVGQSMYACERYVSVNDLGTAALFQQLIEEPVQRVVVASSMSIYGEGLYRSAQGHLVEDAIREFKVGGAAEWEICGEDGRPLQPLPTPESKRPCDRSVYALTKLVQERLTLTMCRAYGMEGVALRLFNVFGSGQALSNPYTGVLAIFAARLLNGERPMIFEDGQQRRDFVHVADVAEAFALALERPGVADGVFNIGSGVDRTVASLATDLAAAMGRRELTPEITGKARFGDIRHCFADISRARDVLGFNPSRPFRAGLEELVGWVASQRPDDRVRTARAELEARGLVA